MSRVEAVALLFRSRPNAWIDGREIARRGGAYAWRTRISDCRTKLAMPIENMQVRQIDDNGEPYTTSLYRYVP